MPLSEFKKPSFAQFKRLFEAELNCKALDWIESNIRVKKSRRSRKFQDLPKYTLANALLSEPPQKFIDLYKDLFKDVNNLNGRSYHAYACDQVDGYMKEEFHFQKLKKLHPHLDISFKGSEYQDGIREIYMTGAKNRAADLLVTDPQKDKSIDLHLKSNIKFLKTFYMTFRGGKEPEINKIKSRNSQTHILVDGLKYFRYSDLINNKDVIDKEGFLKGEEAESWGGNGAYRIFFKESVSDLAKKYEI